MLRNIARRAECTVTTLENGLRVATSPSPGHFTTMGIYINAGSRFETNKYVGASHILDRLAFKTTQMQSGVDFQQKLDNLGGTYMCASSRETMMYQGSIFSSGAEKMFAGLAETVSAPRFTQQDVDEQIASAEYEIREINQKPELILPELAHTASFVGGIGNPLLCPSERLAEITPKLIEDYHAEFFVPERIVTSFVGVEHDEAVRLTEQYLGHLKPRFENVDAGLSQFVPGVSTSGLDHDLYHLYVSFEGVSITDPDVYALAVLQTALGGGGSFSAGGPGKGMYSRFYTEVLNVYGFVESCISYNHSYSDTGLFGVSASCEPAHSQLLGEVLARELTILANYSEYITEEEISRAKNQLRSSLLMNLESLMVQVEDLGRQVQLTNKKATISEMRSKIESLTVDDIRRVAKRVISGPIAFLSSGGGSNDKLIKTFKKFGLNP